MWQYKNMLKILMATLLLLSLILYLTSTGESTTAEVEYTGTSFILTEQAGRDILEGWRSDRAAKETYKAALDELYGEWQAFKGDMTDQISEIKNAHAKERQEWEKALRQSRCPGFGVFGGVGYTTSGEVQGVVGVGLVWKIF